MNFAVVGLMVLSHPFDTIHISWGFLINTWVVAKYIPFNLFQKYLTWQIRLSTCISNKR